VSLLQRVLWLKKVLIGRLAQPLLPLQGDTIDGPSDQDISSEPDREDQAPDNRNHEGPARPISAPHSPHRGRSLVQVLRQNGWDSRTKGTNHRRILEIQRLYL